MDLSPTSLERNHDFSPSQPLLSQATTMISATCCSLLLGFLLRFHLPTRLERLANRLTLCLRPRVTPSNCIFLLILGILSVTLDDRMHAKKGDRKVDGYRRSHEWTKSKEDTT